MPGRPSTSPRSGPPSTTCTSSATVVRFADAVYAAAVELGGWPADLVGPRLDGWHASRYPVFETSS